jgi:hypothetical protein
MDDLSRMVNTHGMNLLELFNAWANQKTMHVEQRKKPKTRTVQPYVGIFLSRGNAKRTRAKQGL